MVATLLVVALFLVAGRALGQGEPPPLINGTPALDLSPSLAVGSTQFMNIVQQGMALIVPIFVAVVGVAVVMRLVYAVLKGN